MELILAAVVCLILLPALSSELSETKRQFHFLVGLIFLISMIFISQMREDIYFRSGLQRTSIGLMQDTVTKSPLGQRPRLNLAYAYQTSGYNEAAIREYNSALILYPKNETEGRQTRILASMNIGQMYLNLGQIKAAQDAMIPAWNADPFPGLANNIAQTFVLQNKFDLAMAVLNVGIQNIESEAYPWMPESDRGLLYFNRAEIFRVTGQKSKACQDYGHARRLMPDIQIPACPAH